MKYFERILTELAIVGGKCIPTDDCQNEVKLQCPKCVRKWDPPAGSGSAYASQTIP